MTKKKTGYAEGIFKSVIQRQNDITMAEYEKGWQVNQN